MEENDQPAMGVETPVDDPTETTEESGQSTETQTDELEESLEEGGEDDSEIETEYEGKKYKVPKELKDALLRQADYTRKTQEVAAERQTVEQTRAEFEQNQRAFAETVERHRANIQGHAQVVALDMQLQQFQQVNWQALADQDPAQAQKLYFQFNQLKDQRQNVVHHVSRLEQESIQQQQRQVAQRLEQAQKLVAQEIKDWSPEMAGKVRNYAKTIGYTEQELGNVQDPRMVKLLHRAYMADQAKTQVMAKPKAAVQAAPIKTIRSGSGGSSTSPDRLSADEWAKQRNAQLAKRSRS